MTEGSHDKEKNARIQFQLVATRWTTKSLATETECQMHTESESTGTHRTQKAKPAALPALRPPIKRYILTFLFWHKYRAVGHTTDPKVAVHFPRTHTSLCTWWQGRDAQTEYPTFYRGPHNSTFAPGFAST